MRFFGDVGEESFRTAPDGRRFFYSFGPWSRPYIVPDAATEQRLIGRQRWVLGILLGLIVTGQQILRGFAPNAIYTASGFLGYFTIVWLGYLIAQRIILRGELRSLARAESRLSLHDYYADMASHHEVTYLVMMVLWAVGLIGLGAWLLMSHSEPAIGWAVIAIFVCMGAAWTYALALKLTDPGL